MSLSPVTSGKSSDATNSSLLFRLDRSCGEATHLFQMQHSQVCQAVGNICVVRPSCLLIDAQGTFIQGLRLGKLQALIVQDGYVGQGLCYIWVIRPQGPFSHCQLCFICPWIVLTVLCRQRGRDVDTDTETLLCAARPAWCAGLMLSDSSAHVCVKCTHVSQVLGRGLHEVCTCQRACMHQG